MATLSERPVIDFLILADRAEAVNGKLYLMGGAWDQLFVNDIKQPVSFSLAIGVLVPWNLTNQNHALSIHIEHEDGREIRPTLQATVNVGRPSHSVPGQWFRAILAIQGQWLLPDYGTYCVVASLSDADSKRTAFHVKTRQGAVPIVR